MGNYTIGGLNQMASQNEVATVLSHFNSQFIYDVIQEKLEGRFNISISMQNANIVQAFNQNFKDLKLSYPSDIQNIEEVEKETYKEIISMICDFYQIQFNIPDADQTNTLFTIAFYLYDFLVSNFFSYISIFYARYIYTNKDQIYDSMEMDVFKKNKDSSTLYNKKVFVDPKIAIVSAHLMIVVKNMRSFDITVEDILSIIYGNANIVTMISSIVNNITVDFFKNVYEVPQQIESILYTNIRLEMQRLMAAENGIDFKLF